MNHIWKISGFYLFTLKCKYIQIKLDQVHNEKKESEYLASVIYNLIGIKS